MPRSTTRRRTARRSPAPALRPKLYALRWPRRGLTVIEMLIATLITLVMMAAVVNLFANLSASIRNRRAVIELSSQIRQVRQQLARDLAGCTVPLTDRGLVPWQRPGEAIGYFEYIEDRFSDADPSRLVDGIINVSDDGDPDNDNREIDYGTSLVPSGGDPRTLLPRQAINGRVALDGDVTNGGALGDWDDILALTVRSEGDPFVGNYDVPDPDQSSQPGFPDPGEDSHWMSQRIESSLAEVVWYAIESQPDDPSTTNVDENIQFYGGAEPGMRMIYRRVLLIAPWLTDLRPTTIERFHRTNDVSVHRDVQLVPNTLADATRREYRFGRFGNSTFPHPFNRSLLSTDAKHLVLNDALAFDVRAYDPGAPLFEWAGVVVQPGDPGWDLAAPNVSANPPVGYGAYADLGWDGNADYIAPAAAPIPLFQQERRVGWHPIIAASNPNMLRGTPAVYDTWTWHYENDGLDQETILEQTENIPGAFPAWRKDLIDQATNLRDDDGVNGVDDPGERETWPPYNVPLRGVKVLLRIYERDARQVREASVTNSFVP